MWSRQLGPLSEQLVAALVCQIFEGAAPHAQIVNHRHHRHHPRCRRPHTIPVTGMLGAVLSLPGERWRRWHSRTGCGIFSGAVPPPVELPVESN
jgi:hypothetical protein